MELGVLRSKDIQLKSELSRSDLIESLHEKINTLATKCILDIRFKGIQASAIACAILFYVRKSSNIYPIWHEDLSHMTFHDPMSSKSTMKALELIMELEEENNTSQDEEKEEEEEEELVLENNTTPVKSIAVNENKQLNDINYSNDPISVNAITTPEINRDGNSKDRSNVFDVSPVSIVI